MNFGGNYGNATGISVRDQRKSKRIRDFIILILVYILLMIVLYFTGARGQLDPSYNKVTGTFSSTCAINTQT
jgi:hypothetical protein